MSYSADKINESGIYEKTPKQYVNEEKKDFHQILESFKLAHHNEVFMVSTAIVSHFSGH